MAWGANFNFSIWFIELGGLTNPEVVNRAQMDYEQVRNYVDLFLFLFVDCWNVCFSIG